MNKFHVFLLAFRQDDVLISTRMKTTFTSRSPKGFTLIELIVVIAILGTLASISYPVIMSYMDTAKKTSATKVCTDIVEAVTRFSQDNAGALPYRTDMAKPNKQDQISLVTADNKDADMLKILTNREEDEDNRLNTNKEFYLRSDEQETKADGLYVDPNTGALGLYDPWGSPYYVILCEESEGCIDPFTGKRLRGKNCIVYGLGPDQAGVAPDTSASSKSAKGKKNKKDKKGKKDSKPATDSVAVDDEEAIEDNVYSWKKVSSK